MFTLVVHLGFRLSALRSKNRFIALTSRLATLGIMLGVATLMTVIAVMQGFEDEIRYSLVRKMDHLQVYSFNDQYPDRLLEEIQSLKHVDSVFGYSQSYALLKLRKSYVPVMLMALQNNGSGLGLPDLQGNGIYLSNADNTLIPIGKKMSLIVPQENSMFPKVVTPNVLGTFDTQSVGNKMMVALMSFDTYANKFPNPELTGLMVVVDDLFATQEIKQYLKDKYHGMYYAFDWKDKYQALFNALQLQRNVMVFVLSMITLVAMFSLVSGLVMMSADKNKEIAVLRTIGVTRNQIMRIFMLQGFVISIVGVLLGVGLGLILCAYATDITHMIEHIVGSPLVDKRIYGTSDLPVSLSYQMVLSISGFGLLLGILASVFPARKAARIEPAEVLRYG